MKNLKSFNQINEDVNTESKLSIQQVKFADKFTELKKTEGLVLLGAGGDLNEWVSGITDMLNDNGILKSNNPIDSFSHAYSMKTTGGRIDLILIFKPDTGINIGKMAQEASPNPILHTVSDWLVNYASHYAFASDKSEEIKNADEENDEFNESLKQFTKNQLKD